MTVACVLRSGGPYGPADVVRLQAGVAKHLALPHRFVCFSDVDVPGAERIPLQTDWPKWWPKLELFRGDLRGLVLYLDLDTVIVGDLSPFAQFDRRRALLRDFYFPARSASGVMIWWDDAMAGVWNAFNANAAGYMRHYATAGDQAFIREFIGHHDSIQDLWPGMVVSFKAHCTVTRATAPTTPGRVPEGARIVCFHGKPKPSDLPAGHWLWAAA